MQLEIPHELKPLQCHGVTFAGTSGSNQLYGSCPFCDDTRHFYVNSQDGRWDCKKCGTEGNVYTFLEQIVEMHRKATTDDDYRSLSRMRGLSTSMLKRYDLAWTGDRWLIPIPAATGRIHDVRRWNPRTGKIKSTTGCRAQLLGAHELAEADPDVPVWVCEGEWDAMALTWMISLRSNRSDIVVAVPGANTFKKEWGNLFHGRCVNLAYDNDDAGRKGATKAAGLLGGVASSVHRVVWPDSKPSGFDVRDLVVEVGRIPKDRGRRTLKLLEKWLKAVEFQPTKQAISRKQTDPHSLASRIIDDSHRHNSTLTLRFYQGRWWAWRDGHYRLLLQLEFQARINDQLRTLCDEINPDWDVTQNRVTNVMRAMEGMCIVEGDLELPAWLGDKPKPGDGDLLAMANGLLDLEGTLAGGDEVLHDTTPEWFCLTKWPYPYDPDAGCPKSKKFLKEVLPGMPERRLLQEFLGYCLTFDTQYHKFIVLVGTGANGKSVVTEVATQLIGQSNVTHIGLERFHERFAMAPTIGKLANIASEIAVRRDVAEDVLKAVTSGDRIQVEFKYQTSTEARPTVRLIFATNEPPLFKDRSDAIWRRILIVPFEVTIPEERQDRNLALAICSTELRGSSTGHFVD